MPTPRATRFGKRRPLAEILEELAPELATSLRGKSDGELLTSTAIPEDLVFRALAIQRNLRYVDPREDPPKPEVEQYLPNNAITDYQVYPHALENGRLVVLTARPGDLQVRQELMKTLAKEHLGLEIAVAPPSALRELVDRYRMRAQLGQKAAARRDEERAEARVKEETEVEGPIVEYVNALILRAVDLGASDIHIEPSGQGLRVRLRVDGKLRPEDLTIPPDLAPEVITRIKIMANLDIAERRRPQDGRISFRSKDGTEVNLRVNVGPVQLGNTQAEQVVMRLLPRETDIPTLDSLGFHPETLAQFERLLDLANGIILVTGPTGSGKSTTLAAAISHIVSPELKILSIEDPVEYRIPGVIQSQVNEAAGYTFATALRAFLRQDPDVIYVGEIRDAETAGIAIQAALTGHLVFGTLHTNDAPSSVTRLLQMGLKPYNVAGALRGVLAQRLVRKVCPRCQAPLPEEDRQRVVPILEQELGRKVDPGKLVRGTGKVGERTCPTCGGSGYKGRTGIHELFFVTPEISEMIAREAPTNELREAATASGMRLLRVDGLLKVAEGTTTLEEVMRATVD